MEGELVAEVDSIINAAWDLRAGQVIPETEDITLGNSGVTLDATVLYADLADSTELAIFDREIAAEVYKAYLVGTTRLIKADGGEIRSFDGDRVMGVFIGNFKNNSAARAALKINYFFTQVLVCPGCGAVPGLGGDSADICALLEEAAAFAPAEDQDGGLDLDQSSDPIRMPIDLQEASHDAEALLQATGYATFILPEGFRLFQLPTERVM
jgi:class 3 adenylate cyclase